MNVKILFKANIYSWIVFIVLASFHSGYAQFAQLRRIEQPIINNQNFRKVISLQHSGALLVMCSPKPERNKPVNLWEFICYDTNLTEKKAIRFALPNNWRFKDNFVRQDHILLIFDNRFSSNLFIYRLDFKTGEGENFNYYAPVNFAPEWFCYTGQDDFYIGGRHKFRPIAVHYNMQSHYSHIIAGLYDAKFVVKEQFENQNNTITLVLERGTNGKEIILQTYGKGGIMTETKQWKMPKKYRINDIKKFLETDPPSWICSYSADFRENPQGFMILDTDGMNNPKTVLQFKFINFKNFFNHFKKRKKERLERRVALLRSKGKEFKMGYKFLLHAPIYKDSLVFVMADAYFPHYSYSSLNNFGVANPGMNRSFDGYQYTHYLVSVFDTKSNLLWEYSGKASNQINYELEKNTCFLITDSNKVLVFYYDEDQIFYNVLASDSNQSLMQKFDVQGFDNPEERSETENLSVTPWYKNYLIASGIQSIQNTSQKDKPWAREVNFISKIEYRSANHKDAKKQ